MRKEVLQSPAGIEKTLCFDEWKARQKEHELQVDNLLSEYVHARSRHLKNPLMDFLFEYYTFRPAHLRKWSPGLGIALETDDPVQLPSFSEWNYNGEFACLDLSHFTEKKVASAKWILQLLKHSLNKKPAFGCSGMHEWAMVYKIDEARHKQLPLRMAPKELAEFVESRPVLCTHFDAFRFFTPEAHPLNRFELSREKFQEMEQPGCIHTNMDLYKWAFKGFPWISSETILEAFIFAVEARTIDMQASPYDMSEQGLEPIKIETEEGRVFYKQKQEDIFNKGLPIRKKLIGKYEELLLSVEHSKLIGPN